MFNLRFHEPRAHEANAQQAQGQRQAFGRHFGQHDCRAGELLDQDLGDEEGVLDHGTANGQLTVVYAGDQASEATLQTEDIELAAPLSLVGSLWALLAEAH